MAFTVSFSISQSVDGKTVTLTDITNYGDAGVFNKVDFTSRTLFITPGTTLVEASVSFPFTNTNNATQDTYSFVIDQDMVYSIRMVLVDKFSVQYSFTASVILTEYTNQKLRAILSSYSTCGCSDNCQLSQKIQCGVDAATARTCAGDIQQAQQIMVYVNELADNHNNCS
jgi:hypothetical protein